MTDPENRVLSASADLLGGRWEVHAVLSGAMGTVLLLVDPATGGRFAAKTPGTGREVAPAALQRFQTEARTWMSLGHHENVVEAFFLEEIEWRGRVRPFLFLEFVDGPTLEVLVKSEGRLAVPAVLDLATGMAWGMAHAHGEGREGPRIVHRDLKPENVFLTKNRVVKVSDFGIARALDRPEEAASEGAGLGTPFYAAPEQMKDARSADVRSDVYSYGAVLFHLLAGEPPFPARDLSSLVMRVLREPPRAPSAVAPGVPPELDKIVLACLAKQPSARPRNFTEILERVSAVREIDALWTSPPGSRICAACGWLTTAKNRACPLCGKRTEKGLRYAPASRRHDVAIPTLGRASGEGRVVVEGVEIRPRVPRAGDEVVVTVLLGNPSGTPVERVSVPYSLPDRDAFVHVDRAGRRGFRGTVPPTTPDAPIRVSWSIRPLREGAYRLPAPRASHRTDSGKRRTAKGEPAELVVERGETAPLVGRRDEIARLTSCIDAANAGRAGVVVLLGQTGTGKSRLARSLRPQAEELGFAWARGRCLDRGVEVRGALREALRQLLDLPRGAARAPQIAAAVLELLGANARSEPGLSRFLVDELLARAGEPGESPVHLWSRLAATAARRKPLVLLLEDVHADPEVASIALHMAEHARREGVKFLAVVTARPEYDDGEFADAVRGAEEDGATTGPVVVRLGALPAGEAEELVNAAFSPNDFETTAPWLAREMASISGGNPVFLTSLVESLKSHGEEATALVRTEGGQWTAAPSLTPSRLRQIVPRRLGELVLARVAELPEEAGAFASAAAVLGDAFETATLRSLIGDPPSFERSLRTLETAGVLREMEGEPPRIRFREPLVREVLAREFETANVDEFQRLHGAAADLIAKRPEALERDALRLARHLIGAGRGAEAMTSLLAAARRFVGRQAYRRAADVLADAAKLIAGGARVRRDDRVAFAMLRGEVLRFSGDYPGALAAYKSVVDGDVATRPEEDVLATAYSKMGKVHEALGQSDEALYCYAVGLSLRRETGRSHDVPLSLVNLAGLHASRGEMRRAEDYLDSAVAEAQAVGNHKALGRACTLKARIALARGETREARGHVRRALSESRVARDSGGKADAWTMLGHANFREGRASRALAHFRRALRRRQEIGDLAAVGTSWADLGAAHEAAGEIESAVLAYRRAADTARRISSQRGLAIALTNLGRGQLEAGHPRKAREILNDALDAGRLAGNPPGAACTLADLAKAARFLGDLDAARTFIDEANVRSNGCGDHDVEGYVALETAEALAARGESAEAVRKSREASSRPGVSPDLRIALHSLAAELAMDRAEADVAARLAAKSASHWSRARALLAQARVEGASGDAEEGTALLRRAAGALLNSDVRDTLLLSVLVEQARLLADRDPAAASAARARAAELAAELRGRGYASGPGTGFPLDASAGDA
jgi:tetratricopeptide (TPR) repeat protein